MRKTDCFLLNLKELYPNFQQQNSQTILKWDELLNPFSVDEIISAIKKYRRANNLTTPPTPEVFKNYLSSKTTQKQLKKIIYHLVLKTT